MFPWLWSPRTTEVRYDSFRSMRNGTTDLIILFSKVQRLELSWLGWLGYLVSISRERPITVSRRTVDQNIKSDVPMHCPCLTLP